MTKKDSPWKATATTDPSAVGAAVTRALALQLAGQLGSRDVKFPGVLVTQEFLLTEGIKNMGDLRAKLSELNLGSIASAADSCGHVLTHDMPLQELHRWAQTMARPEPVRTKRPRHSCGADPPHPTPPCRGAWPGPSLVLATA
jgi:hypothetical protein